MNIKFDLSSVAMEEVRPAISSEEEYLAAIEKLEKPTFKIVRDLGIQYWNSFSKEEKNQYYNELNKGKAIIQNTQQCATYLCGLGKKHMEKLPILFENTPDELFNNNLDIIDWGCGQGLATMLLCDFLQTRRNIIKTVTLIDPSPVTLERATVYVRKFLPEAQVNPINQHFESINKDDFAHCISSTHLHLFANIIDVPDINLEYLVNLLKSIQSYTDYFLCVNPAYQAGPNCNAECMCDCRLCKFAHLSQGEVIFKKCNILEKGGAQYRIIKLSGELSSHELEHDEYKDYHQITPMRGYSLSTLGLSEWPEIKAGIRRGQTLFYKVMLNYKEKLVEAKCDVNPKNTPIEDWAFLEYKSWGAYTGYYYRIVKKL